MLSASRLAGLVLPVPDVAAAARFYERLGLHRAGAAGGDVRLAAGGAELWLRPARGRAGAGDLAFLTDDLAGACRNLERRGVRLGTPRRQGLGAVVSLRGPGRHRLRLVQPFAAALAGPAGPVIREVWRAYGSGGVLDGPPAGRSAEALRTPLLAVVVPETDRLASRDLYYSGLGLALLGRWPCGEPGRARATLTAYDAGWVLLVTRSTAATRRPRPGGLACVYDVSGAEGLCARLSGRPAAAAPDSAAAIGPLVWSADPAAPPFYLREDGTAATGEPVLPAVRW